MPRVLRALLLATFLLPALFHGPARAQFGKNKVHYKDFRWHTIETEHFDIYYYDGEEDSAFHAARMAERAYSRLSKVLQHDIADRVPVIVYASHTDFQQTNISPGLIPEGVGGITEFAKRRVFLPFTGSYGEFDHVLTHELVHAFQVDLLFGGGSDASPFSFQPPLWFMEGMAEYLSIGGVDPNTEMWLRWSALEGQLIPLHYMSRVFDIRVYRIGQAIFSFIGETYGDEKIGELLRRTVYFRSLDIAVEKTLGMNLMTLNDEWEDYVKRKYYPQIVDLNRPDKHGRRLIKRSGFGSTHLAPSLSPDGDQVVFIKDARFSKDIMLASAIDGTMLAKLVEGERSGDFESLRYFYTSIGWSPDGSRIAFPSKKGGEDVLNILDVERERVIDRHHFSFDALYSPSYHPLGNKIVFAGIRGGKSDLYMVDLPTGLLIQVTDDPYLARDPQWSPDGKWIAYVTDRGDDTDLENLIFGRPKVALLELETGEIEIMAGQKGKNITPQWGPDGNHIAFVSDRDGISDLYVQNLRTDRLYRLTNLITGVTGIVESSPPFSWSRNGKRIVFTTFIGNGWELYQIDDPLEKMQEVELREPIEQIAMRERETLVPWDQHEIVPGGAGVMLASSLTALEDDPTLAGDPLGSTPERAVERSRFAEVHADDGDILGILEPDGNGLTVAGPSPVVLAENEAEAHGEELDPDVDKITLSGVIAETTYDLPDPATLETHPYRLKWAPDFIGAAPVFASNVGFAGSAQVAFSDILSNHVIQIGASVYGSIDTSDLFLGYYNLKHRTNWGMSIYQFRNDFGIFTARDELDFESQIYRGVQAFVSRPFSKFSRIEIAARSMAVSRRVFDQSFSGGIIQSNQVDSELLYYGGPEIALVTDNVIYGYSGPMHGHRGRISTEQAFGDIQFNTSILDYRRYFTLGRSSVFATRIIGGVSEGNSPQIFRIGGAHTLRAVGYGDLEGNRLALANFELRFPLVEALRLGWPLRVGLGGIGGVLFFDMGSAWWNHTAVFTDGLQLHDDFTAGYGFGFRLGLGYFALKYDVAYRTDLKRNIGGSRSFFSIGVDY